MNPYLAYAATIAAGLHGIERGVDPPARFDGNAYADPDLAASRRASSRRSSAFEQSKVAVDAFGAGRARPPASTPPGRSGSRSVASSPTGNGAGTSTSGDEDGEPRRGHRTPPREARAVAVHRRRGTSPRLSRRRRPRGRATGRRGSMPAISTPLLDRVDALVLTGGPDVDPALYGEERARRGVRRRSRRRRLRSAHSSAPRSNGGRRRSRSVAAFQVLNVALGGTLHQHIPDVPGRRARTGDRAKPAARALHEIDVAPESLLARCSDTTRVAGSCHHHQAVAKLGDGLRVTAAPRRRHRRRSRARRHVAARRAVASRGHRRPRSRPAAPLRRASRTHAATDCTKPAMSRPVVRLRPRPTLAIVTPSAA